MIEVTPTANNCKKLAIGLHTEGGQDVVCIIQNSGHGMCVWWRVSVCVCVCGYTWMWQASSHRLCSGSVQCTRSCSGHSQLNTVNTESDLRQQLEVTTHT